MPEYLRIEEPTRAKATAPQWRAFLELAFRPLYLGGCLWAAVSIALWVYAPSWLNGPLPGVLWHAHEMLWGFIATIAIGFLLTAVGTWTGINPLSGRPLGALVALWVTARLAYLIPEPSAFWVGACSEVVFFVWAALAMGRCIYKTRNQRNYGVPLLVLGLGIINALYLAAVWQGNYVLVMERLSTGLLCMALIALLVARRVIPFFAMRAMPGLQIPMLTHSGHWQLAACALAVVFGLLSLPEAMAVSLATAGILALVQTISWKPWAVLHKPLLWILYIGYASLGVGLTIAAAHAVGWVERAAWSVHVIGVAGFSVLIIGMVTRTALGHLGRPLQTDWRMVTAYILVITAAILRLMALLPVGFATIALDLSAATWVLAFALYLWHFFPMLIRPRLDAAASTPIVTPTVNAALSQRTRQ
jgi:uncharacterized protein involved in response to NO